MTKKVKKYIKMADLFTDIEKCVSKNVYLLKDGKEKPFAIQLPAGKNSFTNNYVADLISELKINYKDDLISDNPSTTEVQRAELIDNKKYNSITELILSKKAFKHNSTEIFNSNYLAVRMSNTTASFLFLCKLGKSSFSLKQKYAFMQAEDKVKTHSFDKLLVLTNDIDLIFDEKNMFIYSLTGNKGLKIINHSENMKIFVKENLLKMNKWKFLSNIDYFTSNIDKKCVYEKLYVALSNDTYCAQINSADPKIVKKNIQANYEKLKDNSNYDKDNKLIVTKNNVDDILKVISKGLKYNFFIGKTEDEE